MTQPALEFNGCPWPVDPACLGADWDALDPTVQERAVALASETLHRLTGYRVGGCPIIVRPCKKKCATGSLPGYVAGAWMTPHLNTQGMWINSCGCNTDCSCTQLCEVALPGPVGEVLSVHLDEALVDPQDYRLDGCTLVWTGFGDCPWPTCQDLTAPVGAPGAFAVEYLNSYPVDALGAYAVGVLAAEYAKACTGAKCRLPMTVSSVARQGVVFDVPTGAFPNGFTGIREVDTYLAIWNPQAIRQSASVWSPDIPPVRVVR